MVKIDDPTTAHLLAVQHGIDFWPTPCPSCHDDAAAGRPLALEPGQQGQARFTCSACQTTFARNHYQVQRVVVRRR